MESAVCHLFSLLRLEHHGEKRGEELGFFLRLSLCDNRGEELELFLRKQQITFVAVTRFLCWPLVTFWPCLTQLKNQTVTPRQYNPRKRAQSFLDYTHTASKCKSYFRRGMKGGGAVSGLVKKVWLKIVASRQSRRRAIGLLIRTVDKNGRKEHRTDVSERNV